MNLKSIICHISAEKLKFPINVARNAARQGTNTLYLLSTDIDAVPSPGLDVDFLGLIHREQIWTQDVIAQPR